ARMRRLCPKPAATQAVVYVWMAYACHTRIIRRVAASGGPASARASGLPPRLRLGCAEAGTGEPRMTIRYLHTMVRVLDLEKTIGFFRLLGLEETRRIDNEKGRYTLVYLAPPG